MRQDHVIDLAKQYANPDRRRWLEAAVPAPYHEEPGDERYPCRFFMLEGTPLRGFVLAHAGLVVRLDGAGRCLKRWRYDEDARCLSLNDVTDLTAAARAGLRPDDPPPAA